MKKFFVIAALLLAGFTASAQANIGAGYMWNFWSHKNGNSKTGTDMMHGIYAGVSYNIGLVEGLGIAPGAYFLWGTGVGQDANGKPRKTVIGGVTSTTGTTYMGMQVPVHLTYSADLGGGKFFAYLGPAFEYGFSLKTWTKVKGSGEGNITSENLYKMNEANERYNNPFDVKLGVGFGYNWKFIQANVGFDFGFLNRDKTRFTNPDSNFKCNANDVHAGIAFVF
jgi:hypothetical protein